MQARPDSTDDVDNEDQEVDIGMEDVTDIEEIDLGDMTDPDVPPEIGVQLSLEEEQSKELDMNVDDEESGYEDN